MKKIGILIMSVLAYAITFTALFNTAALAAQNDATPAIQQQAPPTQSPVGNALTDSQPQSGKTGLSKRNQSKIELEQQRQLRQIEIDKELADDPQPR
jgi:hypothetical protein